MATTERLRLEASMKDDASPAIKKLRGELHALNESTKDYRSIAKLNAEIAKLRKVTAEFNATPGMKAAEQWFRTSASAASTFTTAGGGVAGILGTIGLGALGAAGSMAAMVASIKGAGDHMLDANEKARQLGVSLDYLLKFESTGKDFGLSVETMDKALAGMAAQLPQLKAGVGPLLGFLTSQGWPDLAKKLGTEDTAHALDDILHQLDKIKNPAVRSKVLGDILGTPELEGVYGRGGYAGFVERFKKQKPPQIDPGFIEQTRQLRDAQNQFNQALERFEVGIGPKFLAGMTSIISSVTNVFTMLGMLKDKVSGQPSPNNESDEAGATNRRNLPPAAPDNPYSTGKLRLKMADHGGGGLLHFASFEASPASASGDPVDALAEATKRGFLLAYREIVGMGNAAAGAETPNLIKASYGGEGGGFGAGTGGRGGGGGTGVGGLGAVTAVDKTLPKEARALLDALAAGEAKDYNVMNGGGTFSDFSHHPGGRAAGRYQDLPSTWRRISGALGLKDFSPESQDKGNWWLAQQDYRARTHRDLLGDLQSKNPGVIANIGRALHSTWVSTNGSFAGRYAGALGRGDGAGGSGGGIGIHLRTLSEQCVDLARAAVGATGTVREWRRGVGAMEGTLKPGTPIATFLDKAGRASERYAGGGIGTMGAHRDHAGVFQSYIRDKDGKPIGFNMAEQYKGSHGAHSKAYMFGRGWGEGNASNYSAVAGSDGQPLGGDRNPMNRRATGLPNPAADAARAPPAASHVHLEIEHPPQSRVKVKDSSGPITTAFKRQWGRHDWSMTEA